MPKDSFNFPSRWWMTSRAIRSLAPVERDFCMTLFCLMSDGEPYGSLVMNKQPMTRAQVSSMTGIPIEDANRLLTAALKAGALHRDERTGIIYSPQMRQQCEVAPRQRTAETVKSAPTHIPADWEPTADEFDRMVTVAITFWPTLSEAEIRTKLQSIITEFRNYWTEMRLLDERNKTKYGMKSSWYMTLRRYVKDLHYREQRMTVTARLRESHNGNGNQSSVISGAVGDARRIATCTFCEAHRREVGLPPCRFHPATATLLSIGEQK